MEYGSCYHVVTLNAAGGVCEYGTTTRTGDLWVSYDTDNGCDGEQDELDADETGEHQVPPSPVAAGAP